MIDWAVEITVLNSIKRRIDLFKTDVAALGSLSPKTFIVNILEKLQILKEKIDTEPPSTSDLMIISTLMLSCLQEIKRLTKHINNAEKIATKINAEFQTITANTVDTHAPFNQGQLFNHHDRKLSDHSDKPNFLNIKMAGANVWASILDRNTAFESLPGLHIINSPKGSHEHLLHNSLVHLLKSTDEEFIEAIDIGQLAIEGEIGNIIIQRLKNIRYANIHGTNPTLQVRRLAIKAGRIINRTLGSATGDGLFKCDFEALHIELTKLALHAELYPNNKTVWLGTARSVFAIIEAKTEIGTYLNCDDKRWTWHLNRLWLQAALFMGFKLELIEQHYPSIEYALLSCDGGARFVQELLRQVRENAKDTSQYNGYDAPTATAQEILVALDVRCCLQKGNNNRIQLTQAPVLDDTLHSKSKSRSSNPLHHSWESSFSAPTSPLKFSKSQFFVPESSVELRKAQSKPVELVLEGEHMETSPIDVNFIERLSPLV